MDEVPTLDTNGQNDLPAAVEQAPQRIRSVSQRELAEAVKDLANLPGEATVEMTPQQFRQAKMALWWHRELYSGGGLRHLFPGLKRRT